MSKCTCPNKECEIHGTPPTPCSTCNGTGKLPWTHPAVKKQVLDINNPEVEDEYPCPDSQHSREPELKPLAQYLAEYLARGIDRTHEAGMPVDFSKEGLKLVLDPAFDAYESTENVLITIIKKKVR